MRSIVCRYETAELLAEALASPDRELPVIRKARSSDAPPESHRSATDGEWVLAIVELSGRASAAAARIRKHGDSITIVFEPRDWSRVKQLAGEAPATDRSPVRKSSQPPRSVMKKLGDAGGARILLVDDDVEVREVVSAMLEAVGFAITAARSGEDGLGMLERERFDLVVLDWTLPGMSGLELCRAVRARWAKLPVLFLTANAGTRDVVEAFAGGADDYVVKPFRAPELGARIFGLLRRATAP
ncbi:MAG TPA: response regulator [Polyangiaceae bacterium]|nr:response regulator [Polyangiaceae bacterium]